MKRILPFLFLICAVSNSISSEFALTDFSKTELSLRQVQDTQAVNLYRRGLLAIIEYMNHHSDLFPQEKLSQPFILKDDARQEAREIWKSVLDHYLALDSIAALHNGFMKIKNKSQRRASFQIARAAMLAEYRAALDFITLAENNPAFDTLFNESVSELGLSDGMYAEFKFRFLNVFLAGEFAALEAVSPYFGASPDVELKQGIEEDRKKIWAAGKQTGPVLTFKNGIDILKKSGQKAWFPVQKGISTWMGDTKVYRKHSYLIKEAQIQKFKALLEPGDILLERREWYLTNVGIPGFWSHAALYIGTPDQRRAYFDDPDTISWIQQQGAQSFEKLLQQTYPKAYYQSLMPAEDDHHPAVLEAIGKGVVFTSIEFSAACDSLAVLRPRLPKKDKARALFRAFQYYGRPYDYNFDFLSENSLVCTELIYKAYQPGTHSNGLQLPLEKCMGRLVTPANAFAREYSRNYGSPQQQMDLILFMDGYEKKQIAVKSTPKAFQQSWKRPKWHILVQALPSG